MNHARHSSRTPLSAVDWHVLVSLERERRHGYGIMKAVREDSGGAVTIELGSLYRVLSRLMTNGLVSEVDAPAGAPAETRGRPRRYYELTTEGRVALGDEARRMRDALSLARRRRLIPHDSR